MTGEKSTILFAISVTEICKLPSFIYFVLFLKIYLLYNYRQFNSEIFKKVCLVNQVIFLCATFVFT